MPALECTAVAVKNILFATDFSTCSDAALPYVESIAGRYGSKVYIAHVVSAAAYASLSPTRAYMWPEASNALVTAVYEACEKRLARLANLPEMQAFQHEAVLAEGDAAQTLLDMVPKYGIDLMVVGTHGRHGLDKLLMGTVTEPIAREARCPVLIVGPRAPHQHSEGAVRQVLFATDFTPESASGLHYAISMAEEHDAQLTILAVIKPGHDIVVAQQQIRNLVPPETAAQVQLECVVCCATSNHIAAALLKRARESKSDIIVLGGRGAGAGKLTYKIVSEAPCAVLTVPA